MENMVAARNNKMKTPLIPRERFNTKWQNNIINPLAIKNGIKFMELSFRFIAFNYYP